jgi:hypothetical protein
MGRGRRPSEVACRAVCFQMAALGSTVSHAHLASAPQGAALTHDKAAACVWKEALTAHATGRCARPGPDRTAPFAPPHRAPHCPLATYR